MTVSGDECARMMDVAPIKPEEKAKDDFSIVSLSSVVICFKTLIHSTWNKFSSNRILVGLSYRAYIEWL